MKQIGIDFQGWPIYAMTLMEILKGLGFKDDGEMIYLENDNPILYAFPRLLKDDGMGYGVDEEYVVTSDKDIYDTDVKTVDYVVSNDGKLDITTEIKTEKINVFNLFRESPENKVEEDE